MNKIMGAIIFTGLLVSNIINLAQAEKYRLTDLGTFGGSESVATAINDEGIVVGFAYDSLNQLHGFIYDGKLQKFSSNMLFPSSINNSGQIVGRDFGGTVIYENGVTKYLEVYAAYDINNFGQVVGYARPNAFLYENNVLTNLGRLPNTLTSYATAINDNGVIVGVSGGVLFIYQDGEMRALDILRDYSKHVKDINNNDQIVGHYINSDGLRDGFIFKNGAVASFDFNGKNTYVIANNNLGEMAGYYQSGSSLNEYSALYVDTHGNIIDLNTLMVCGSEFERLAKTYDINNLGQIVGIGVINGENHGFLLSPDNCEICVDSDADGYGDQDNPNNTCPLDNCSEIANPNQNDFDNDSVGDACDNDDDNDDVTDELDQCPNTLVVDMVDPNTGCSLQQLTTCDRQWRNHGDYVSNVSKIAHDFAILGLLNDNEKNTVVSEAANSICGIRN